MCGSGTHPGGGVTGLTVKNAAREILKDRYTQAEEFLDSKVAK